MLHRFKSLGLYAAWQPLWAEWHEGIVYGSSPNKRTVPMKELERDFSEGRQKKGRKSLCVAWRNIRNRNAIRDRKIIIYGALQAQHYGKDPTAFMNALQKEAQGLLDKASRQGNKGNLMSHMKRKLEEVSGHLSPFAFEKEVLG